MMALPLPSTADTEALGARLAGVAPDGCVIYLRGELGAGKTTLVRGFLRALGHRGAVRSPTYTLVEPYSLSGREIVHLDLYRLAAAEELEFLGLRDWLNGRALILIEWPERGEGVLPAADLEVWLEYAREGRVCRLNGVSAAGKAVLSKTAG